ncbi:MAG: hypothetical protein WA882_14535, partial [Geitlerinemataceae cyanobacterium]
MPFSDATNPNAFGDTDPLAAGIPPLYTDRILDDGLPQAGSIDPLNEPAFTVIENPVIDASGTVSESPSIPETVEEVSPIDANLETLEMADGDPLIHADDTTIDLTSTDADELPETDSEEETTVEETDELEATDNETSNTSQSEESEDETEEEAIADDVEATDNETSNTSQSEESEDET